MNKLERKISFIPAMKDDAGAMLLVFHLKGPAGSIVFDINTGWYQSHSSQGHARGLAVNYHSPVSMYEDQRAVSDCSYLDGRDCYCDGSCLSAAPLFNLLLTEGEEAVWKDLEEQYAERFPEDAQLGIGI
jgi:hypothetical protein